MAQPWYNTIKPDVGFTDLADYMEAFAKQEVEKALKEIILKGFDLAKEYLKKSEELRGVKGREAERRENFYMSIGIGRFLDLLKTELKNGRGDE